MISDPLQRHRIVSRERELHDDTTRPRRLDHLHVSSVQVIELLIEVPRQRV
jgi:hypothetical protein